MGETEIKGKKWRERKGVRREGKECVYHKEMTESTKGILMAGARRERRHGVFKVMVVCKWRAAATFPSEFTVFLHTSPYQPQAVVVVGWWWRGGLGVVKGAAAAVLKELGKRVWEYLDRCKREAPATSIPRRGRKVHMKNKK